MNFILQLTFREVRTSWKRLLFFFISISIGVASVVALRSLVQNISYAVAFDARELLTADIEISSTNEFTPSEISAIEEAIKKLPVVEARAEAITTSSMARPVDPRNERVRLVELKGIDSNFPLVGNFVLDDNRPFEYRMLEGDNAIVSKILLEDLGIRIGDKIRIAGGEFRIIATFDREPGGNTGFRLGPRIFIEKKAFDEAGITRNAGRVRRRILLRTNGDPTPLVNQLRNGLRDTTVQVQSYRETQENLGEQFSRTENYLALTGLLILVLGGVGVWNVARAFVEQKRKTVAILKCLGASGNRVITVYLFQILFLGLMGSLFGVGLAQIGLFAAGYYFRDALPQEMSLLVSGSAVVQGIVLGIVISFIFSALPLLQIRHIKPRLLLVDRNSEKLRLGRGHWFVALCGIVLLFGVSAWQAGSLAVGVSFLLGTAVVAAVLYLAATILIRLLKSVKKLGYFPLSQAINSLYRPGNQTRVVLLAVGLGVFVVLSVSALEENLTREFDFSRNSRLPSLFFVDIQKSQIDSLIKFLNEKTGEIPETTPTVRARIAYINGKAIDFGRPELRRQQGQIGREFAVTYRSSLDENETITDGRWWNNDDESVPEVSVEQSMADRLGVKPGDSITFDISGRNITARVANIRKLDLRNTRTAFIFVFRPGVLDTAPQTFAATVLTRMSVTDRQKLQREVIELFPNVQIFDVADILTAVNRLIGNFVLAISFVGGFVILSGILILIGSVALTKSQRVYENAVLKTLGATRTSLATTMIAEYGLLGFTAALIGAVFALVMSWAVCRFLLDIQWQMPLMTTFAGAILAGLLVTVIGTAANFDVLFRRPLTILRTQ
ncbi:MAG: ABC transporter permease [Pyrinomonadaceae bacterium]